MPTAAPARPLLKSLRVISESAIFSKTSYFVCERPQRNVPLVAGDILALYGMRWEENRGGKRKGIDTRATKKGVPVCTGTPFRIEVTGELVNLSTCRPCRLRRGLRQRLPWFLP